jgi:hypothetical protein
VSGHPEWRAAVHEAVEAWFAARSRRARRLYSLPEGRERADRIITGLLDRADALWEGLDPVGAPAGPSPDGKVVMLASFDLPACVHYRVEQKAELLRRLGRPCEVYGMGDWEAFIGALPGAAAAIVFRAPAWPTVMHAVAAARRMGVPTFYEVDDLIFDSAEFPAPLETYGGLLSEADYEAILFGTPLFRKALSLCDHGIATTTALARAMAPLVGTGPGVRGPERIGQPQRGFPGPGAPRPRRRWRGSGPLCERHQSAQRGLGRAGGAGRAGGDAGAPGRDAHRRRASDARARVRTAG